MHQQINLSEKQKEIVHSNEEALYVLASAGSGKTRILTERIRVLLQKTKRKVLALTFTTKAANEMNERLLDVPDIQKRAFIGTFHGFCQNVLENHGHLIGYKKMPHIFEEENDRLELIEQAIEKTPVFSSKYKMKNGREKKQYIYKALQFIGRVKRELLSENELLEKANNDEHIVLLYRNYQDILFNQNAIDFDDLILLTYELFISYPKISALYRRTYEYICIDEAQDLNKAQYGLLLALTEKENRKITMVGDPNQSIFAFNGSSPKFMVENFIEDFNAIRIDLKENFRSSKKILEIAEKIIPETTNIDETVIEGQAELLYFNNEKSEAKWVTAKIKELVEQKFYDDIEGEVTFEKIAVLARNKYVFKEIEQEFCENKIPHYYKMTLGSLKFESKVIQIFNLALKIKLNPKDILHKKNLIDLLGENFSTSLTLLEIAEKLKDSLEKDVLFLINTLSNDGSNLIQKLKELKGNIENLNLDDDDEKRMIINDIAELRKHWANYAKKTERESLHQFKNRMALGQTHPLTQHNGVTLSTVHTMKGQEFDVVFLVGMDDGTFPDYRAIKSGGVELIQEKNNVYVAVTRAKRFIYITYPKSRVMPWGDFQNRKISRFLEDINI